MDPRPHLARPHLPPPERACSYARAAAFAFRVAVVLASPAAPRLAHASPSIPVRTVEAPRITVSDIVPSASAEIGAVDLGPAPLAGSNRLVKREEVLAALPGGGLEDGAVPPQTRIVRATSKLTLRAIEGLIRGAAPGGLPKGATLLMVRPRGEAVVPRGYDRVELVVPRPPRKVGRHATVATLRLLYAGATVATLSVPLDLQLGPTSIIPAIRKGAPMAVVVAGGAVEVQAPGKANEDAEVGEVLQVTVEGSGKVLRARLVQEAPPRGVVEP